MMIGILQLVLIVTVGIGVSGAILSWRERPEPGALPLTVLLAGLCWWSATLYFRITASTLPAKVFWVDISWIGIAILPVAWVYFCLSYTGYHRYLQPKYVVLLSIVPLVTIVLGVSNDLHHLMYTESTLSSVTGTQLLDRTPGIWFWIIALYTYLLGVFGAIPLLQFLRSDVKMFQGQTVALLIGLIIPWVTNLLYVFDLLPVQGVDPTPIAFSISGMAFLGALTRFQLLGTSPAPIQPARRSVFNLTDAGVIVLDRQDTIVDMNDKAEAAFNGKASPPLGNSIDTIIPEFPDLVANGSRADNAVIQVGANNRSYELAANELTTHRGRSAGQIITLHDISEYLRQQQRLEVLNRVFRHNIRTNVQVILSHVDHLADHNSPERAETAAANAMEIQEISEKIRTILNVFEHTREEANPVKLDLVLGDCIESVRNDYPSVDISSNIVDEAVYIDSLLTQVISQVVDNAASHNTNNNPEIRITIDTTPETVQITVQDNGPGINDEELAILTEGTETPLKHGTGLGLALITWGIEIVDGTISVTSNASSGTKITLTVPHLSKA